MNNVRMARLCQLTGSLFLSSLLFVACNKQEILNADATNSQEVVEMHATLSPIQQLGKKIFFDSTLSESGTLEKGIQSCASCHLPEFGFAAPGDAEATPLYKRRFVAGFAEGAVAGRFGTRKSPTAAYTSFSPKLENFGMAGVNAEFAGGMFWDGRATGWRLNSPLAEQVQGPFLDKAEQNHLNARAVLLKIQANANNYYGTLWQQVWGTPLSLTTTALTNTNYDRLGRAVAAYLSSNEVNKFNSKYDKSLVGQATLTAQEIAGLDVFNNKGNCAVCHTMGLNNLREPFTDYGMDNIGVPRNPSPLAPKTADGGFGAYLNSIKGYHMWKQFAPQSMGLFKTPTVRNLTMGGNRRYGHNGYFTSLEQIIHFYNTAMVPGAGWNGQPWPAAETPRLADAGGLPVGALGDVGNLGLTNAEEAALVAFLKTLNDDWTPTTNRLITNN